jgi:hypothetical protein
MLPVSLAQLVGTSHYICHAYAGFKPQTPHLFTLKVKFLAIRLLDKKKVINTK